MAAPLGNQNATKNKPFMDALNRAIAADDGKRLRAAAEKLLDLSADGESWAIQFLADRTDGKVKERIDITSGDEPIRPLTQAEILARVNTR